MVTLPPTQTSYRSWLAIAGAASALYCTVGFINAFGVFQEYYVTLLEGHSASDISWIGSLSIFLLYVTSPLCGMLVDCIGPTISLCVGSIGMELALFMTSLCTQYWQLMLAQALLLGISMALVFCPPLGVVSRHMPHRRGLALGLTIGGSSVGGIIWPIMLQRLLIDDGVSFGWTLRAVAFKMIPLLAFACFTVVEPQQPIADPSSKDAASEKGKDSIQPDFASKSEVGATSTHQSQEASSLSFLRGPTFLLLALGLACAYLGLFAPLFYISTYAVSQGQTRSTAFYLLSAVNASSFFGRVVPGHMADRLGHYNLLTIFTLVSAVVGFTWTQATSLAGMILWGLAYGFSSGAIMSLQGACAGKIAPFRRQGAATGTLMGCLSITALVGTPISGQIVNHSGYLALSMWTGSTLVGGVVLIGLARMSGERSFNAVF